MADLDIAAMDAAQKLAFARAVGSVILANVEVSAPEHELIIAIPDGYFRFGLDALFTVDAADSIYFQFSTDGGSTYHSGETDYLTVVNIANGVSAIVSEDGGPYSTGIPIIVGDHSLMTTRPATFSALVYPGGDSRNASVWNSAGSFRPSTSQPHIEWWYTSLEVTTTRVTHMKIIAPNAGADNFTGGYYSLIGYPEPA